MPTPQRSRSVVLSTSEDCSCLPDSDRWRAVWIGSVLRSVAEVMVLQVSLNALGVMAAQYPESESMASKGTSFLTCIDGGGFIAEAERGTLMAVTPEP